MRCYRKQDDKKRPPNSIYQTRLKYHTNARHTAGRFASIYFPAKTLFRLTKVNKQAISDCEPINWDYLIFAFSRLENAKVNNLTPVSSTRQLKKTSMPELTYQLLWYLQIFNHSINKIILLG